jgi:hypothetical protein
MPTVSISTRETNNTPKQPTLFDIWENKEGDTFEDGWKNKLIWGDNLLVMESLLEQFAGKVNLIYIDPPFATGADFSFKTQVGDGNLEVTKEQSIIEEKAYRDTWGQDLGSYLQMLFERLVLIHSLLSEDGSIFVHCDYHVGHSIKLLLDEVFGTENFRNELILKHRVLKNLQRQFKSIHALPWSHDTILWYSKSPVKRYRPLMVDYETRKVNGYWHHFWSNADRPTMRYELLGVTPKSGQWKWRKERALGAVENYKRYLEEAKGRSLVEYWEDTGSVLEFIRLSKQDKVENWFPPSSKRIGNTIWMDIHASYVGTLEIHRFP